MNIAQELAYLATSEDAGERHCIRHGIPVGTCIPFAEVYTEILKLNPRNTPSLQAIWKERIRGFVEY